MTAYADLLPVAHQAVDPTSSIMRRMQPGVLTAKGDRDMASEVDYAMEEEVPGFLTEQTPDIAFLGAEQARPRTPPPGPVVVLATGSWSADRGPGS